MPGSDTELFVILTLICIKAEQNYSIDSDSHL